MVMRNRHEGSGAPQWWDDLPPRMRHRFTQSLPPGEPSDRAALPQESESRPVSRGRFLVELTRFAALCGLFSVIILLYLLVALSYVKG